MGTARVIAPASSAWIQEKAGSVRPGLDGQVRDQDAFFLRRLSTNLIRSTVPSQSLVVAGWKPFFWPSERRSNATLSLVGASVKALAIAAFRSSGSSEL